MGIKKSYILSGNLSKYKVTRHFVGQMITMFAESMGVFMLNKIIMTARCYHLR